MIKKWIVLLLVSNCSLLYAQTIKTDVLVIGDSPAAMAAAIQSARSKVKTILAIGGQAATGPDFPRDGNREIASGIWGELQKHIQDELKNNSKADAALILEKIADTVKNLNIYLNAQFSSIKKDGDRWEAYISQNGKTIIIKPRVVIDATENGAAAAKAGAKYARETGHLDNSGSPKIYRTAIAAVAALPGSAGGGLKNNYPPLPARCTPLSAVVLNDADNILLIEKALPAGTDGEYLPLQIETGQGAGAVAAYCAFFKTTTKNLKVRVIQGELLDFKSSLLPFTDIPENDPNWRAIQQVCSAGLLKGVPQTATGGAQFNFRPDSLVSTAELQPVLTEIYTRAFLWFGKEKPGAWFTVGNLLSFISDYTLTDPQTLKIRMQKNWKSQYQFNLDFDLGRPVTRREFAVLANKFLNPFGRTVDLEGRLVN